MTKYDSIFHPIGLTRRGVLRSCCLASLAFLATNCSKTVFNSEPPSPISKKTVLKVGHLPAGCVSHLLLANKRGMFKEAGLNVQVTQFNGPNENLQALIGGGQDVIHNPWTNSVAAYAQGSGNLRIIGGSGKGGIELVSRNGSVKTLTQLKDAANSGLRIGTLKLDTLELVVYGHLRSMGIDYFDYRMSYFPSMTGMGEALIKGDVDVCSLAQPYAETVVTKSNGTYLGNSNGAWGPEASDCVISSRVDVIKGEPNLLSDYLAILRQAAEELNQDYDAAIADLAPVYNSTPQILKVALRRQSPQPVMDKLGLESLDRGVKLLADLKYLRASQTDLIRDVFDGSIQERSMKVV
jgi:NitT/TauT family transport system substrate-binding protein